MSNTIVQTKCVAAQYFVESIAAMLKLMQYYVYTNQVKMMESQCMGLVATSKEPVGPRVELIFKIIIILLIIFLGFIKSKPC